MNSIDTPKHDSKTRNRFKRHSLSTIVHEHNNSDNSDANDEQGEYDSALDQSNDQTKQSNRKSTRSTKGKQANSDQDEVMADVILSELATNMRLKLVHQLDGHLHTAFDNLISSATTSGKYIRDSYLNTEWLMNDKRKASKSYDVSSNFPTKEFRTRDSVLTELFQISHMRTVFNIFVAVLIILLINTIIHDAVDPQGPIYIFNLNILRYTFGKLDYAIKIWCMMMLSTICLPYWGFSLWQTCRGLQKNFCPFDLIALGVYVVYQLCFILFPLHLVLHNDMPPVSTLIVLVEQIRMFMKSHAFLRASIGNKMEYVWRECLDSHKSKSHNDKSWKKHSNSQSFGFKSQKSHLLNAVKANGTTQFSHYLYFLFAPTLVFRTSYPRTASIRWKFVFTNLLQFICCAALGYYIFVRFCFVQFSSLGKMSEYTVQKFLLASTACTLPGGFLMMTVFYGFLHSWLNAFAELLRFGDRLFYKDWWNATRFSVWYRSWNVVVHDWLYAYVYRDIMLFSPYKSRALAATMVFWISAAVHEYVITVCLRFWLPVMFANFAVGGVVLFFIQGKSRGWNVLLWILLFQGNGEMMCLYSMEWYSRKNCPPVTNSWLNYFIPHSIFCSADSNLQ